MALKGPFLHVMTLTRRAVWLGLAVVLGAGTASADEAAERRCRFILFGQPAMMVGQACSLIFESSGERLVVRSEVKAGKGAIPAAFSSPGTTTATFSNTGFELEPGEPTEGGLMTRTAWFRLDLPPSTDPRRIVIHSFGSGIDTLVAVYSVGGPLFSDLVRVAGNNDFTVPGVSTQQSLVQFTATPGVTYLLQAGAIGGAQGDVVLTGETFEDEGGLSAFLYKYSGNTAFNNREYFCTSGLCPTAGFIVYNATASTLDVTGSATPASRFTAPPAFQLAAGAAAAVDFVGTPLTDSTTRTEIGAFVFEGRASGEVRGRASKRAVTRVRGGDAGTTIAAATLPAGRASRTGAAVTGFMTILNTGAATAKGCHVRAAQFSDYTTFFQATDPATNLPVGAIDAPFDIAPGAGRTLVFSVESQGTFLGEPDLSSTPLNVECANATGAVTGGLANTFAFTSIYSFAPADMISIGVTPSGDGILNVPSGGQAFAIATVNIGASATVTARPVYARPFSDPAGDVFTASICETNPSNGQCLAPPAASVSFTAAPNVVHTFTAFVQRPANAPAFSPAERRMLVEFRQDSPEGFISSGSSTPVSVGSTSAAVRAQ